MDGLALTSVIATSVVGLGGVTSGVLSGAFDRRHLSRQANEARQQERLDVAYVKILHYVRQTNTFLEGVWAPGDDVWSPPPGPPPSASEHEGVAALVDAYGSQAVRMAEGQWWSAVRQALLLGQKLERRAVVTGDIGSDGWVADHHAYLDAVHGPVEDRAERLVVLVNAELRPESG